MTSRWGILAVLFAVRATMGFQFQSVAAVAPILIRDAGIGLADIGLLIGLYLAPGVAVALPGGALGRRFGDKTMVLVGLALMGLGGLLMAFWPSWTGQVAGRLIAGLGGVLLNVLMSKMVTDWFAGREIASAMAIFVNSWPVGIAAALVVLPPAGSAFGVAAVHVIGAIAIGVGFALLSALYRAPPSAASLPAGGSSPTGGVLAAVLLAGAVWSLYNVGFAMIFGFGPAMLAERGWTVAAAGTAVSIVMWLTMLSVPAGGFIADWSRRHVVIIVAGCVLFAGALLVAARTDAVIASFVVLGIVCGVPAGPIMSLPARVLGPETRSVGMGIYFTVYYAGMFVAPAAAGWLAARLGGASAAFDFGAAAVLCAALLAWIFPRLAASVSQSPAAIVPRAATSVSGAAKP
jgi:MFS family permease